MCLKIGFGCKIPTEIRFGRALPVAGGDTSQRDGFAFFGVNLTLTCVLGYRPPEGGVTCLHTGEWSQEVECTGEL